MNRYGSSIGNGSGSGLGQAWEGMVAGVLSAASEDASESERKEILAAGKTFALAASRAQRREVPVRQYHAHPDRSHVKATVRRARKGQVSQDGEYLRKRAYCTPCLLVAGRLGEYVDNPELMVENRVKKSLLDVWGYSTEPRIPELNVLLDTEGGVLDSAFKIVLYLSWYAGRINVYVPRRAKSAGTLIAVGADRVYLSPFSELGPLDTQILDPRNPTKAMSALDCYLSVDYVRQFGYQTLHSALQQLVVETNGQVPLTDLISAAAQFALDSITPLMQTVKALDFGAWGRSLKIGERYAMLLLNAKHGDAEWAGNIAQRLVYYYTHHPYPIDYREAKDQLKLDAEITTEAVYRTGVEVIRTCKDKLFVGFISDAEARIEQAALEASKREQAIHNGSQANGLVRRRKRQHVSSRTEPAAAALPREDPALLLEDEDSLNTP